MTTPRHPTLAPMHQLLEHSQATAEFKQDVLAFCAGHAAQRIEVLGFVPRLKIERLLAQMLAAEAALEIERIEVRGRSGCSDFSGTVVAHTPAGAHAFDFVWDCRWRAEQEGWTDAFGFPDQIRAAREFGWQCFERWAEREEAAGTALTRGRGLVRGGVA